MTTPRSRTLFHFTKNLDVLKSILKHGFFPKYSLEDIAWFIAQEIDAVAFPVVSFCDIPLSRIGDHVNFYGRYGIGMKQDWGIRKGFNPIVYVSETSDLADLMQRISKSCVAAYNLDKNDEHLDNYRRLAGFCKPLEGKMIIKGNAVAKVFYQESEWRYLAGHKKIPRFLMKQDFDDRVSCDRANALAAKHCALKFLPDDVKYIFVGSDEDIPELVNFINVELGHFPHGEVQTLITKIITQDIIADDI